MLALPSFTIAKLRDDSYPDIGVDNSTPKVNEHTQYAI